jgi:hypothetical protein
MHSAPSSASSSRSRRRRNSRHFKAKLALPNAKLLFSKYRLIDYIEQVKRLPDLVSAMAFSNTRVNSKKGLPS